MISKSLNPFSHYSRRFFISGDKIIKFQRDYTTFFSDIFIFPHIVTNTPSKFSNPPPIIVPPLRINSKKVTKHASETLHFTHLVTLYIISRFSSLNQLLGSSGTFASGSSVISKLKLPVTLESKNLPSARVSRPILKGTSFNVRV